MIPTNLKLFKVNFFSFSGSESKVIKSPDDVAAFPANGSFKGTSSSPVASFISCSFFTNVSLASFAKSLA